MVELSEICEIVRGVVLSNDDEVSEGGVKVLRANNIDKNRFALDLDDIKLVRPSKDFPNEKMLKKNDIFICMASGSKDHIGKVAYIKEDMDYFFGGFMGSIWVQSEKIIASYLFYQLSAYQFNNYLRQQIAGANINNLSSSIFYRFQIPLPPFEFQKEIVAEIEAEQALVYANRELIARFEKKIQAVLARVWGEGEAG